MSTTITARQALRKSTVACTDMAVMWCLCHKIHGWPVARRTHLHRPNFLFCRRVLEFGNLSFETAKTLIVGQNVADTPMHEIPMTCRKRSQNENWRLCYDGEEKCQEELRSHLGIASTERKLLTIFVLDR